MESDTQMTNAMRSTGRPRRGTEATRLEAMMAAATRAFLRDRYDAVSIGQVAREAGVSTRTIYNRLVLQLRKLLTINETSSGTMLERLP